MFKLNKDILFLLFEELQDDSRSLFSCLMVSRIWCEIAIPVLWKNPWRYDIKYYNKKFLYYIITYYLTDNVKKFLTSQGIPLPQLPTTSHQSLLFDYLSFCRSINVTVMNKIISIGSFSDYNQFLLQQEIYSILMEKCLELKHLDMRSLKHQIFYFSKAKVRLNSLCELKCDTSIDSSYFYGLARICQYIQRLIIINNNIKFPNHGIVDLIEVQNNLKYFEWKDDFLNDYDYFIEDPYGEIFLALTYKAETLNHFIADFQYTDDYTENTFLQNILPELGKLKTLKIDSLDFIGDEQLKLLVYRDLEIFKIDEIGIDEVTYIIENSGGRIKEILIKKFTHCDSKDSPDLIRTIYENCPLIEYLSLEVLSLEEDFTEFELLLKSCQKLKSFLIICNDSLFKTNEDKFLIGENLLKILIRSAPNSLKEIRIFDNIRFSLKNLENFFEIWRGGRTAISILTSDLIYESEDYTKLISKYKYFGVIKDFRCVYKEYVYFDD